MKLIVQEFKIWLGLTIAMGIHKLSFLKLYWSNDELFTVPQFMTIMTSHQYQQIKSHLYFIKLNEIHTNLIRKIRFLLETFQQRCMSEWSLDCEISTDEMIVLTKLVFFLIKIQINTKLICDGMKIFFLCNVKNGYFYAFLVYDGTQQHLQIVGSKTMNVIVTLASKLLVQGFNIKMNNFYLMVLLFRYLHNIKQNVIRTTQSN
jgi:hypothetical protein